MSTLIRRWFHRVGGPLKPTLWCPYDLTSYDTTWADVTGANSHTTNQWRCQDVRRGRLRFFYRIVEFRLPLAQGWIRRQGRRDFTPAEKHIQKALSKIIKNSLASPQFLTLRPRLVKFHKSNIAYACLYADSCLYYRGPVVCPFSFSFGYWSLSLWSSGLGHSKNHWTELITVCFRGWCDSP